MKQDMYDVAQVGYGPVGQVFAGLMGQFGYRAAVFEQWPDRYAKPRAGHVDHEAMRILQSLGVAEAIADRAWPMTGYDLIDPRGETLLALDWNHEGISGWHSDYLFYTPYMEQELDRAVRACPNVDIYRGWKAIEIRRHADHVELQLQKVDTGELRVVRSRYLIGADGANSTVRESLGVSQTDLGFKERFLVMDVRPHDPNMFIDMPLAGQICDPQRPISLFRWLGLEHCRWEFMLRPDESADQLNTLDSCWGLLARWGLDAANSDLIRHTVYTFSSLLADRWREGQTMLLGDAAHLMPPFMGQGMCSGFRDAKNLSWKLDLVLSGRAGDELLDSYELERRPHARALIEASMNLGRLICVTDVDAAAQRDELLRSGDAPPPPPFPALSAGVLHHRDGTLVSPGGQLARQARIRVGDRAGRFDDVIGQGWSLIVARAETLLELGQGHRTVLEQLGAHCVSLTPSDEVTALDDYEGHYRAWLGELNAEAVLVRPDHYVYGSAGDADELAELLNGLRGQLRLKEPLSA